MGYFNLKYHKRFQTAGICVINKIIGHIIW